METTTTSSDATTSQPRPPPPPPPEAGSSRPTLQTIKPRNEKRQHQPQSHQKTAASSASSLFRKVVFIAVLAFVAFFQLFRNIAYRSGGFVAKTISKQQQQQQQGSTQRQGSVVSSGSSSSMAENINGTHATTRITSNFKNGTTTITSLHEKASPSSFRSRNNVTSKALEQKINHWLMTGVNNNNNNNNNNNDIMLPKPPNTPGAFIHVGKTGGSTLCSQLRNACHSWVKKPCSNVPIVNESRISLLTTYYHTPDFHLLRTKRRRYDFYVWTLRDPFSRLLSAFTYQHPRNMGHAKDDKYWAKYVRQSMPAFSCFPTLESFASAIGNEPDDFDYPFDIKVVNTTNCTRLARAMMQNKVLLSPSHFYHDMKQIQTYMPVTALNATILAIRTEYLWDDWITANQWLGQRDVVTFPTIRARQQNETKLPITKDISPLGQQRLCRALKDEYKVYFELVERAVNLGDKERQETYALARRNCPEEVMHLI